MTERLPIFPLRTVLFPGDLLPLHVFEPRYRLLLSRCAEMEPCFGVVLTKSGREVGDRPETFDIGASAVIVDHADLPDGRSNILVQGARRFRILEHDWDESYMVATVRWLDTQNPSEAIPTERDAVRRVHDLLARYLEAFNQATGQRARFQAFQEDPTAFAYAVASSLPMPVETRQRLLEAAPPDQLLSLLVETVRHETALLSKTGAYAALPGQAGARFTSN